jgi:hypothetical protein
MTQNFIQFFHHLQLSFVLLLVKFCNTIATEVSNVFLLAMTGSLSFALLSIYCI